jgi:tRNA(Leu) C34 or U34 (ribose-2'-O)-methylase TrmL
MVAVAGLWELAWNTPIKEIELWIHPLRDFGCDEFYMAPVTGIAADVTEVPDLGELIAEQRSNRPIVFVDEAGQTPLHDFVHPDDPLYVFGKTSLSPLVAYGREEDQSVFVSTVWNRGLLWADQAAVLVLYDRMLK